jgi:hypothetical protein
MTYNKIVQTLKPLFETWKTEEVKYQELIDEYTFLNLKNRRLFDKIPNEIKPYINYKITYNKHYNNLKTNHPDKIAQYKANVRQAYKDNENIREHKRNNYLLKKIDPLTDDMICKLMENINVNFKELEIKEQLIKSIKGIKDIFKKE